MDLFNMVMTIGVLHMGITHYNLKLDKNDSEYELARIVIFYVYLNFDKCQNKVRLMSNKMICINEKITKISLPKSAGENSIPSSISSDLHCFLY